MAHANRRHTRRHGSRSSGFRKRTVLAEKFSGERFGHFRMLVIRGEYSPIVWHVKHESKDNLRYLERLLEDEGVGIAPNAADALGELAGQRVDIGGAVPALEKALGNRYAKINAALALAAHHLQAVNIRKLEALMKHPDPEIRNAVSEFVSQERSQDSVKG